MGFNHEVQIELFNSVSLANNLNSSSDRAPNLGGLARTSEIFGIKRLLIGNNHILKNPEFLSLSVTAHRWLEIEEVFAWNLITYLRELKKNENYTLIGVEQSTESVCLTKFEFPERSILVLGNEKEGLPVELLQVGNGFQFEVSIQKLSKNLNFLDLSDQSLTFVLTFRILSHPTDDGLLRRNTASWSDQIAKCACDRRPGRLRVLQAAQLE